MAEPAPRVGSTDPEPVSALDARVVEAAGRSLGGTSRGLRERILPFLGPAFIACVAYIDPGNFATNIQGGAAYGYLLVWVVVAANLMAMLIQTLSAKLGIVTGRNLAEVIRDEFPRPAVLALWVLAEVVAMATDLAEFLGAALGFYLLFGIPLFAAALLTGVATLVILALQRRGFRPLEAVITALVGVVGLCYLAETVLGKPDFLAAGKSFLPPRLAGTESVVLATGILGATVMPHVIYLHSALTQSRVVVKDLPRMRRLLRYQVIDVVLAMSLAGLINVAMLLMAAVTFHRVGAVSIASIEDAHKTLIPLLGSGASTVFAISLLVSGLSSSTVGTMAGQVIMQGFLRRKVPILLRRVATMVPALVVIYLGLDPTRTLVLSQVVLSFGIPFALIPLVVFTGRKSLMGPLRNHPVTATVAWILSAMIVALNIFLVVRVFGS
ncbi:MAG: manganese transport protein [Chloroflexota bacterium]|jgi:manganese transport protein|nr:manganese transport protein [Chloroflexota bacterium]